MYKRQTQNITGQKRAWEPGAPPEGPPPVAEEAVAPADPAVVGDAPAPAAVDAPLGEAAAAPEGEAMAVEPTTDAPPTAGTPANGAASGEGQDSRGRLLSEAAAAEGGLPRAASATAPVGASPGRSGGGGDPRLMMCAQGRKRTDRLLGGSVCAEGRAISPSAIS